MDKKIMKRLEDYREGKEWHIRNQIKMDFTENRRTFCPRNIDDSSFRVGEAYRESQTDPSFQEELNQLLRQYVGRETPLYYAKNLTQHIGGAKILSQTGRPQSHRGPQD